MRVKSVLRYDQTARMYRVARLMWDKNDLSTKLSLAFWPKWFRWGKSWDGWDLTVLGVRVHYRVSHGGRFV